MIHYVHHQPKAQSLKPKANYNVRLSAFSFQLLALATGRSV